MRGDERRAGIGLATFGNSGYLPLALMEVLPVTLPELAQRFATSTLYIGSCLLVNSPALWSLGNWLVAGRGRPRRSSRASRNEALVSATLLVTYLLYLAALPLLVFLRLASGGERRLAGKRGVER